MLTTNNYSLDQLCKKAISEARLMTKPKKTRKTGAMASTFIGLAGKAGRNGKSYAGKEWER